MISRKLLKTVRFYETEQWNVKYFLTTEIASEFPINDIVKNFIGVSRANIAFKFLALDDKFMAVSIKHEAFERKNEALKRCTSSFSELQEQLEAYKRGKRR